MRFTIANFPKAVINPIGSLGEYVDLNNEEFLSIRVPISARVAFEQLFKRDGGIGLGIHIAYGSKDIRMAYMQYSGDDIRSTEAFKNLDQGGAAYVTANHVQRMLQEISQKKEMYIYRDPRSAK